MATVEIKLPEIGEGVTEGELVSWLVSVGDSVEIDQPLAEVMTDKATVEIPSSKSGTIKELKAEEGDIIPVEQVIIVMDEAAGSSAPAPAKKEEPKPAATSTSSTAAPQAKAASSITPPPAESSVLATPSTRRLAREMSVDINQVSGSGLAGRVTRDDVLSNGGGSAPQAQASKIEAVKPSKEIPRPAFRSAQGAVEDRVALRGIRRKIAENMQLYKQIIPHFSLMDEVNVTRLYKMRTDLKPLMKEYGINVTYLPFVMKAIIATCRDGFEMMNASIDDAAQEIVYKRYFNIGFAADTPNGLVVPVIKNADQKSIWEISQEIMTLAEKARAGKLSLDDMSGASITITNIGSVGGTYATPIINHPEVAIIGMYKMTDKPILRDGKWRAIKSMNFSCTADHRLIDGAVAARFMTSMLKRLENPARLMLDLV
ncbi:MAG: dihydrolipoamide acetyltransferase family protein [Bdellovibrionales bacterium]